MCNDGIQKSSNEGTDDDQNIEWFDRELRYQSIMSVARNLQKTGVLDEKDVVRVEKLFNEKYKPIYRDPGADK